MMVNVLWYVFTTSVCGVCVHIGVGIIVYSCYQGHSGTSSGRIGRDMIPRFIFMYGSVWNRLPLLFQYGTDRCSEMRDER